MLKTRRKILMLTAYTLTLAFSKTSLANWIAGHYRQQTIDSSLKQLFPEQVLRKTNKIHLKLPRIAENGFIVPMTITSTIKNPDTIYIFAQTNPVPLVAKFSLNPELETFISTRFKMQETGDVVVVLKADKQYYQTRQKVKITLGGCGG